MNCALYRLQLNALIWKNFVLKKRSPGFLVVELLAPLFLFLLIVIIRDSQGSTKQGACYLQPRALPSAGLLPFIRTLFCTVLNKCYLAPTETIQKKPPCFDIINSTWNAIRSDTIVDNVDALVKALDALKNQNISKLSKPGALFNTSAVPTLSHPTVVALDASILSTKHLPEHLEMLAPVIVGETPYNVCALNNSIPNYIQFPDESQRIPVSKEVCSLNQSQVQALTSPTQKFFDLLRSNPEVIASFKKILDLSPKFEGELMQAAEKLKTVMKALSDNITSDSDFFLCGDEARLGESRATALTKSQKEEKPNLKPATSESDPELSPECNKLFMSGDSDRFEDVLWVILKPLMTGKIFYAPTTELTNKLMQEFNRTFVTIHKVVSLMETLVFFQNLPTNGSTGNITNILMSFNGSIPPPTVGPNQSSDAIGKLSLYLKCISVDRIRGFSTHEEMEKAAGPLLDKSRLWASFFFNSSAVSGRVLGPGSVPEKLVYTIRQRSGTVPNTERDSDVLWIPDPHVMPGISLLPLASGQAYLIDMLEKAFIRLHMKSHNRSAHDTGIWIEQFPTPCYVSDEFMTYLQYLLPFVMVLSWIASVSLLVKTIVYEKETRLKEVMKVMGLKNSAHWISYFVSSLTIFVVISLSLCIVLKAGKILTFTDFSVVFALVVSFAMATITFCFFLSTWFSQANLAAALTAIIFFCTYLPFTTTQNFDYVNLAVQISICIFPNSALSAAFEVIVSFERQGIGAQWGNINKSPDVPASQKGKSFSVLNAISMLWFDAVFYMCLALLVEKYCPGKYGIADKCPKCGRKVKKSENLKFDPNFRPEGENFEDEPENKKIGVQIRKLVKVYKTGNKLAINDLSINFYEDQITSFLGHNGAGKTTTMSIICGMFEPTKGKVFVQGKSVSDRPDLARKSVGFCPQYNVLFDTLTVMDHLRFYARLRGKSVKDSEELAEKLLKDLELEEKVDVKSKKLSGGMKRRLSVAISFIGDNKVVILDEPTAGVDPHSRRGIWELLAKLKPGRTIILSTHHMDEAEILGDRIAIINDGKLICAGSSLFLKRKYADGYQLSVVQKSGSEASSESNESRDAVRSEPAEQKTEDLTKFIQNVIPEAKLEKQNGNELTYTLPYSALASGDFVKLLEQLEANKKQLNISAYGLSDTSLEDVFLEVAEQRGDEEETFYSKKPTYFLCCGFCCCCKGPKAKKFYYKKQDNGAANKTSIKKVPFVRENQPKLTGPKLRTQQYKGMLYKRCHNFKRNKRALVSQLLLCPVFIFLGCIFAVFIIPETKDQPSKLLSVYPLHKSPYMVVGDLKQYNYTNFSIPMQQSLTDFPHQSFRCVKGLEEKDYPCIPEAATDFQYFPVPPYLKIYDPQSEFPSPGCNCAEGFPECEPMAGGAVPARKILANMEKVQDLGMRNFSDYLVKTRLDYQLKRLYGFQFSRKTDWQRKMAFNNIPRANDSNADRNVTSDANQIAADFINDENVFLWWNNKGLHVLPSSINSLNNLILRHSLRGLVGDVSQYGIKAYSHPWPRSAIQLSDDLIRDQFKTIVLAIFVIIGLCFIPACFVVYLVEDRKTKSKHLQFVSGVNPTIYWLGAFTWDLAIFVLAVILCIIIFVIFNQAAFTSKNNIGCLITLFLLFCWGITPLMYLASFWFKEPATAFVLMILVNFFVGYSTTVATFIFDMFKNLANVNEVLLAVFLIFPQYCLGRGLFEMALNQGEYELFSQFREYSFKSPFNLDVAGLQLIALAATGFVFFGLLLLIENRHLFQRCRFVRKRKKAAKLAAMAKDRKDNDSDENSDEESIMETDVKAEEDLVMSGQCDEDPVVVKKLRKEFGSKRKRFVAVKGSSFHVSKSCCFGLLGVNGAGKTTTFQMLTGDILPTSGEATMGGYDVVTHLNESRKTVGYCPQFDALDELLNVREHIMFYAMLRGIPSKVMDKVTDELIEKMELNRYANRLTGTLSGGNKRKLQTAIALIGDPQIVLLDEPTAGMDPKARRFLWECVLQAVREGRSVILTSHSMEECEALCTNLVIMVNGEFKCMGSIQHIKAKYGDGYIIEAKTKPESSEDAEDYVMYHFPNAEIKEKFPTLLIVQVPQKNINVAKLFKVMESGKNKRGLVEDYSISQTTLDQLFINFASKQNEEGALENSNARKSTLASTKKRDAQGTPIKERRVRKSFESSEELLESPPPRKSSSDGSNDKMPRDAASPAPRRSTHTSHQGRRRSTVRRRHRRDSSRPRSSKKNIDRTYDRDEIDNNYASDRLFSGKTGEKTSETDNYTDTLAQKRSERNTLKSPEENKLNANDPGSNIIEKSADKDDLRTDSLDRNGSETNGVQKSESELKKTDPGTKESETSADKRYEKDESGQYAPARKPRKSSAEYKRGKSSKRDYDKISEEEENDTYDFSRKQSQTKESEQNSKKEGNDEHGVTKESSEQNVEKNLEQDQEVKYGSNESNTKSSFKTVEEAPSYGQIANRRSSRRKSKKTSTQSSSAEYHST